MSHQPPRTRLACRAADRRTLAPTRNFAPLKACFCGALRKNACMLFQCHSAAEKRRHPGGRAEAISYLEDMKVYPVSTVVNSARHDTAECVVPIT